MITISSLKKLCRVLAKTAMWMSASITLFGIFYWYNNTLFIWEAKILWPQEAFSESKFKNSSAENRAKMIVDLIQNKRLLGIESNQIITLLGEETGDYYKSDSNFTYKLTNKGGADWILTLIPGDHGRISSIFVRKSCCSLSRKLVDLGLENADPLFRFFIPTNKK